MSRIAEAMRSARKVIPILLLALICALLLLSLPKVESSEESEEARMARILSQIQGAGRVNVMLSKDVSGAYTGAVIVAEGANEARVILELERAVRTLTGLDLNRIEILCSEE